MSETGPTWDETLQAFSPRRRMEIRNSYDDAMFSYPDGPPPKILEQLQNEPTSTYTEFFRGNAVGDLTVIAGQIAPEIQRRTGRAVRIGMVACSGGEEAYTLAALLHNENVDAAITGMDINPAELQNAREGKYKTFGILGHSRAVGLGVAGLFIHEDDHTRPADVLKDYVNFQEHDILKHPLDDKNPFDIITMYNILYHYSEKSRETIIDNALAGLTPGGTFAYEGKITVDLVPGYDKWADRAGRKLGLPADTATGAKDGIRTYHPDKRNTPEPPQQHLPTPEMSGMNSHKARPDWPAPEMHSVVVTFRTIPGHIEEYE